MKRLFRWFGTLLKNVYFWLGLLMLVGLGLGFYFLLDDVLMPRYTRHDVAVEVPDVIEMPFQEAKQALERRDLRVQRQVGRYNPNVGQNVVVDQTPRPDQAVKPGRRVYLTVNSGEVPTVEMPDLSGLSVREARNQLVARGLKVGEVQPDSLPSPYPNTITQQTPEPGDSLKVGSTVDLRFSPGLSPEEVTVPSVTGLTAAVARDTLRSYRLRAAVVMAEAPDEDTEPPSPEALDAMRVRRQSKPAGASVQAGTEVRLFVSSGEASP